MFRRPKDNRRTVAEFLILAIFIAAVGGLVAFGLDVLKKQAADTKRNAEMKELASALEEYYDSHAEYPLRLEDLVSDGRLLYLPTPAPYGGTILKYVYVPLGNSSICTGYHLGVPLETASEHLSRDEDSPPSRVCLGASTDDFDGRAFNCAVGEPSTLGGENCYDIKV